MEWQAVLDDVKANPLTPAEIEYYAESCPRRDDGLVQQDVVDALCDGTGIVYTNCSLAAPATWDVSAVKNMSGLFHSHLRCNLRGLDAWDTSAVTTMAGAFRGARSFNQNIDSWRLDAVTDMANMFEGQIPDSIADTGRAECLRESMASVISMPTGNRRSQGWADELLTDSSMYQEVSEFNQNINSWRVDAVTDFRSMFQNAVQFNQNINSWRTGSAVDMANMFKGTHSSGHVLDAPSDNINYKPLRAEVFSEPREPYV